MTPRDNVSEKMADSESASIQPIGTCWNCGRHGELRPESDWYNKGLCEACALEFMLEEDEEVVE